MAETKKDKTNKVTITLDGFKIAKQEKNVIEPYHSIKEDLQKTSGNTHTSDFSVSVDKISFHFDTHPANPELIKALLSLYAKFTTV